VLDQMSIRWRNETALTVVMAADGYPGTPLKGTVINNIAAAELQDGVKVFHAGTMARGHEILANGGRVLNVTAIGKTTAQAQQRAYDAVDEIDWPEGFYRSDIGWREITREQRR
jgi:phosphoribosylamine---glycine ligase